MIIDECVIIWILIVIHDMILYLNAAMNMTFCKLTLFEVVLSLKIIEADYLSPHCSIEPLSTCQSLRLLTIVRR